MNRHFSRMLTGLAAAAMMCASLSAVPLSAAQTLAGDVDQNGEVGVSDAVLLYKYLHKLSALAQTAYDNADVTADGEVDVFDLAMLKQMLTAAPAAEGIYIHLNGDDIMVEGDDGGIVAVSGTTVTITASGVYYVDGSITDGQIYVETAADDVADVELVLNDVSFENSTMPAIYTSPGTGSDKTKLTCIGKNTITDTSASVYTDSSSKKLGVIYAGSKLTVTKNSTGTLDISSSMNTAIKSKKKLNLNGGTIRINTADPTTDAVTKCDADAINSGKAVEIEGAVLDIDASADGINSDSEVIIYSGDVSIKAGNDAVQAVTLIDVQGGNVVASGDRGFRLGAAGTLNIDGGKVMATATDYQVNGNEEITITGTQAMMLLDLVNEWKKADVITIGTTDFISRKKYDYVLVSDASVTADGNYTVSVGGCPVMHDADASRKFQNTGIVTQYFNVSPYDSIDVIN